MILPRIETIPGETRVPVLLAGIIVPQVFTLLLIVGRFISRTYIARGWDWDDSLIILAWLNSLASTIVLAVTTLYGQGHHIYDVPEHLLQKSFQIGLVAFITYQLALSLTKLSILFFYLRVFPAHREKRMTWGTIAAVVAFGIPLFMCTVFQCSPITGKFAFNPNIKCVSYRAVLKSSTALHTIADAWLIVMVIPVLSTLQMPRRQKYALIGVLSLGVFVIVTAIARTVTLSQISMQADQTWVMAEVDIWTIWESSIGIICACAPTMRPLLRRIFPTFMGSYSNGTEPNQYGTSGFTRSGNRTRANPGTIELSSQAHTTAAKAVKCSAKERNQNWMLNNGGSEEDIISTHQGILKHTEYSASESVVRGGNTAGGERDSTKETRSDTDSLENGLDDMLH